MFCGVSRQAGVLACYTCVYTVRRKSACNDHDCQSGVAFCRCCWRELAAFHARRHGSSTSLACV